MSLETSDDANPGTRQGRASSAVFRRKIWPFAAPKLALLPEQKHQPPVPYSPLLITYVAAVCAAAVVLATVSVRTTNDLPTLLIGGITIMIMAVYAVHFLTGVSTNWSATVFLHLGLALTLGPIGAATAAVSDGFGIAIKHRGGWFRTGFNIADNFLADMAAWWTFHLIIASGRSSWLMAAGGLGAGIVDFLVNALLLGAVIRLSTAEATIPGYLYRSLPLLPYSLGYGWAAFGFVLLHAKAGALGFTAVLTPVALLQGFLVFLERRVHEHTEQTALRAREREVLLHRVIEASNAERQRVASDLHNGVVQNLDSVAQSLRQLVAHTSEKESQAAATQEGLQRIIDEAAEDTRHAMRDLRTLIIEIAPPNLNSYGLRSALDRLLEPLRRTGIKAKLHMPDDLLLLDEHVPLVWRVTQEALRNVAAHSQARHVTVELYGQNNTVKLRVCDDGRGFTDDEVARRRADGRMGTILLQRLARDASGSIAIDSQPGKGTQVELALPVIQ